MLEKTKNYINSQLNKQNKRKSFSRSAHFNLSTGSHGSFKKSLRALRLLRHVATLKLRDYKFVLSCGKTFLLAHEIEYIKSRIATLQLRKTNLKRHKNKNLLYDDLLAEKISPKNYLLNFDFPNTFQNKTVLNLSYPYFHYVIRNSHKRYSELSSSVACSPDIAKIVSEHLSHLEERKFVKKFSLDDIEASTLYICPGRCVFRASGELRLIINQRFINSHISWLPYIFPSVPQIIKAINKFSNPYFFQLDLKCAYYQASGGSESLKKFAVLKHDNMLYQFQCMPFGLASAPELFASELDDCFNHLRNSSNSKNKVDIFVFIDDILIVCESDLAKVTKEKIDSIIKEKNIKLNYASTSESSSYVLFLGHQFFVPKPTMPFFPNVQVALSQKYKSKISYLLDYIKPFNEKYLSLKFAFTLFGTISYVLPFANLSDKKVFTSVIALRLIFKYLGFLASPIAKKLSNASSKSKKSLWLMYSKKKYISLPAIFRHIKIILFSLVEFKSQDELEENKKLIFAASSYAAYLIKYAKISSPYLSKKYAIISSLNSKARLLARQIAKNQELAFRIRHKWYYSNYSNSNLFAEFRLAEAAVKKLSVYKRNVSALRSKIQNSLYFSRICSLFVSLFSSASLQVPVFISKIEASPFWGYEASNHLLENAIGPNFFLEKCKPSLSMKIAKFWHKASLNGVSLLSKKLLSVPPPPHIVAFRSAIAQNLHFASEDKLLDSDTCSSLKRFQAPDLSSFVLEDDLSAPPSEDGY